MEILLFKYKSKDNCKTVYFLSITDLGFGLLESGCVSKKNEVNIMVKNVADVVLGGLSYWVYGYGLQFGEGEYTNWFCGWGKFFLDDTSPETMGMTFANFIFHVSDIIGFRKYI